MHDTSGPADTVMMVIMHDALRRDFARTRAALTGGAAPQNAQRVALAKHIAFMLAYSTPTTTARTRNSGRRCAPSIQDSHITACMTNDQWHAFEKAAMPPFSKRVLAEYFNWFLDDLDEPRRRQAMKALPAPIVFVMTRFYGLGYRRRAAVRWAPSIPAAEAKHATIQEG